MKNNKKAKKERKIKAEVSITSTGIEIKSPNGKVNITRSIFTKDRIGIIEFEIILKN